VQHGYVVIRSGTGCAAYLDSVVLVDVRWPLPGTLSVIPWASTFWMSWSRLNGIISNDDKVVIKTFRLVEPTASDKGIPTEGVVQSQPWPTHPQNWRSWYDLQAVVLNPSERLTTSPSCRTWPAVRSQDDVVHTRVLCGAPYRSIFSVCCRNYQIWLRRLKEQSKKCAGPAFWTTVQAYNVQYTAEIYQCVTRRLLRLEWTDAVYYFLFR